MNTSLSEDNTRSDSQVLLEDKYFDGPPDPDLANHSTARQKFIWL